MKKLYIQQAVFKITDHYPIVNEKEEPIYYVDQEFQFVGKFYNVKNAKGDLIFTIERCFTFLFPVYTITFVTGETIKIRTNFSFFRHNLDIEIDSFTLTVEGDFFDHNYSLYSEREELASIKKKWISWGDAYEITILDETFMDLSVAILIAVDEIIDTQKKSSSS